MLQELACVAGNCSCTQRPTIGRFCFTEDLRGPEPCVLKKRDVKLADELSSHLSTEEDVYVGIEIFDSFILLSNVQ